MTRENLDLDAVEKADKKRTQGRWTPYDPNVFGNGYNEENNCKFISLMSVQVPLMVTRIRELEKAAQIVVESEGWHGIEELRKALEK